MARTSTAEITVLECHRKAVSSPAGGRAGAEGNRVVGADGARPDGDVHDWVRRSLDVDALLDGGGGKTGVYHCVVCQMCVRMARPLAFLFSRTGSLQPGCLGTTNCSKANRYGTPHRLPGVQPLS